MSEQQGSSQSWPQIEVLPSAKDVGGEGALPYVQGLVSALEKHPALSQIIPTRIDLSKSEDADSGKSALTLSIYVPTFPSDAERAIADEVMGGWMATLCERETARLTNDEWGFAVDIIGRWMF